MLKVFISPRPRNYIIDRGRNDPFVASIGNFKEAMRVPREFERLECSF